MKTLVEQLGAETAKNAELQSENSKLLAELEAVETKLDQMARLNRDLVAQTTELKTRLHSPSQAAPMVFGTQGYPTVAAVGGGQGGSGGSANRRTIPYAVLVELTRRSSWTSLRTSEHDAASRATTPGVVKPVVVVVTSLWL